MAKQIILFDGICNLCNAAVKFIIKRDRNNHFLFSSLQSKEGVSLLEKYSLSTTDSIVLIKDKKVYLQSEAILEIAKEVNAFWYLLAIFKILPLKFRDYLYIKISENRYKLFGKRNSCLVADLKYKEKFL